MEIKFYVKHVYGNETMYVLDADKAAAISTITREKTLTMRAVRGLEVLGFTFVEVLAPRG